MIYYKVKPKYDQTPRLIWKRPKRAFIKDGIFVANELYTGHELRKYYITNEDMFETVNINKFNTYWFFGARFTKRGD